MYFVYILESLTDGKRYYGFTIDIERRLVEHNQGKVGSTKSRRPLNIVYYEIVPDITSARRKEKYFKSGFGRKYIRSKIRALSSNG